MLKQFSRLEKTRNFIIIIFAFLIGGGLIVFYVPRGSSTAAPVSNSEVLAKVGDDEITVGQLETLKQQYAQMFGGQINMAALGGDRRFLDGLIRDRIISQEAERLGLSASDAEVAEAIRKRFSDPSGKFMGFDKYKEAVIQRYGSIERFEQQVRDQVAAQKLQAFVTAGVTVSEAEVQDQYKRKNAFFGLTYVQVTPAKLAEKIQPSDEELRAYYEQHKTEYRFLEPQKKIRYLFINQAKVGEKIQVSDEDLRKEYDNLKPENRVAGIRIQQILFKVVRPELDAVAKEKAENLLKKIMAEASSGTVSEEKFAEYARGNSEDAATARTGGFLPKPYRKDPNRPNALYDRMVDMPAAGGVTDVVIKYAGNYYIMRRGEEVQKSFEDAKNELRVSLQNRRSYAVAAELAKRAAEKLKQSKDYPAVARELSAEANMTPEEMIKETPFIKPADNVPDIGSSQQFDQGIAPLNNPNDVGERTPIKGGFAIPMLLEKKDPRIPEFDEVKDKVANAFKQEQARQRLEQTAKDLANTGAAADLKAAAERAGLEAKEQADYKLGDPLGEAGTSPALDDAIYALQAGQVSKSPIKVGDGWVVLGVTKRDEADLTKFAGQRDQLMQTALSERRNQVFDDYVNAIQSRMQNEGKIKIYEEVLTRLAESDPAAGQRQRIPIPGQ